MSVPMTEGRAEKSRFRQLAPVVCIVLYLGIALTASTDVWRAVGVLGATVWAAAGWLDD